MTTTAEPNCDTQAEHIDQNQNDPQCEQNSNEQPTQENCNDSQQENCNDSQQENCNDSQQENLNEQTTQTKPNTQQDAQTHNDHNKEQMAFQAETKDLLHLMINSIYTHKQIFLRELLSNASDAIDKIRFLALTDDSIDNGGEEYQITLELDKRQNTLTICDNGIGMSYQEVIDNIGTIAKSGTRHFLKQLQESQNLDMIGQFGVGFYSAFMVAKKVVLKTRAYNQNEGVLWESNGEGTYSIENIDKAQRGTEIVLYLRDDVTDKTNPRKDFSNQYTIRNLVEEYSNYIQYPIKMDMTREEPPRDEQGNQIADGEWTTVVETKTLNSMTPLWKKRKAEISDEEYFKFYKNQYNDWNEYADVIHQHIEGKIEYYALLFIPSRPTIDIYSKDYSKGIELYSNSIFVMNDCKDLLPEHLRFVRGLVDSKDLPLNISRETLQHDAQLKAIGAQLEKKVLGAMKKLLKNQREKYEEIWGEYGKAIKGGVYLDRNNSEKLQDLLLYRSSHNDGAYTTLQEYIDRMDEKQKEIYYAAGKDIEAIKRMPQLELFTDRNVEVLYFTDKIDEFMLDNLGDYNDTKLVSITREDFDLDALPGDNTDEQEQSDTEKSEAEAQSEKPKLEDQHSDLLKSIQEVLGDKVADVRISRRLKSSPVCLVTTNSGTTFNMEQLLRGTGQMAPAAKKILEINPNHPLFNALLATQQQGDNNKFSNCCDLMYYQALIIEGYELDDPVEFSSRVANLLVDAYGSA